MLTSRRGLYFGAVAGVCLALAGVSLILSAPTAPARIVISTPPVLMIPDRQYRGGDSTLLNYDVYAPADYRLVQHPLLIWIHGGGWVIGDKHDWLSVNLAKKAASLGFVVFDINYRLGTPAKPAPFPAATSDVAAFAAHLKAKLADFNAGENPGVSIGGASAGGQLAMYQASDPSAPFQYSCVVDMAGLSDLSASDLSKTVQPLVDGFAPTAALKRAASPLLRLGGIKAKHFLFIHAQDDPIVPLSQSTTMMQALMRQNVGTSVYGVFPVHGGHDIPSAISNDAIEGFLQKHCV